jgi:hypothetical protein
MSLASLVGLAVSACWPGAMYELGVTRTLSLAAFRPYADGLGPWAILVLVTAAMLAPARDRWPQFRSAGLLSAATVPALLVSARWEGLCATASALRWTFAAVAFVTAAVFWLRAPLARWLGKIRWLELPSGGATRTLCDAATLVYGLPVVLLTSVVVWRSVANLPLGTPDKAALFGRMSLTLSFAVPLLTLVAVLLGHALREKRSGYALGGSTLFQYAICLAYMLRVEGSAPGFVAGILQWNAAGLAGYALLWLGLKPWMEESALQTEISSRPASQSSDPPLATQLAAAWSLLAIMAIWATLSVFLTPAEFSTRTAPLGEATSYLAWGLCLIAAVWCVLRYPAVLAIQASQGLSSSPPAGSCTGAAGSSESQKAERAEPSWAEPGMDAMGDSAQVVALFAAAFVGLVAVSVEPLDVSRHWLAYHVLSCGWLAIAAALTVVSFRWRSLSHSATVMCVLVTGLAFRGSVSDASIWAPWWSVGGAAGAFVLSAALCLRCRSQRLAYWSVVPLLLATSFFWIGGFTGRWPVRDGQALTDFVQANLVALLAAAILWMSVDLWYQRREQPAGFDSKFSLPPVHFIAAMIALILSAVHFLGAFCVNTLTRELSSTAVFDVTGAGGMLVLTLLGFLLFGALWEERRSYGLPCLYVWGLLVIAFVLDIFWLPLRTVFFAVGMAAAAYVMLTGLAWRRGVPLAIMASRCGIREPVHSLKRAAGWLPVVNLIIGTVSMLVTLAVVLTFPERWLRISSGMAPLLLAFGLAALAQQERRTLLEYASLLMAGTAAVCLGWADLDPQWSDRVILLRMIRMLVVSAGLTFVYGVLVARWVRLSPSWMAAVRKAATTFGIGALLSLIVVLLLEAAYFEPHVGAPVATPEVLVVVGVLVGLVAGFISLAVLPGTDPLALGERGRRGYVYAAELVAALIFAHIFLCRPWIFGGHLRQYWPYIVMGIAFAAVGVGEVFRRSGIKVLSEPLQHTSAFLPLLPALGFWVIAAEQTHYATLLFLIGLMYLLLSGLRRSVASGLAAALAGNAALWAVLTDANLSIWNHPQFWLIPPAVSALIAGQINRRRLTASQMSALRYSAVLVIYLSSTSEIFLQGIGDRLWPPMVLAGLSVAGFFLGIALRIRSFLVLGASFVLLSVISMVWHAHVAIQHSWPLWAFGIGLGICILVLFGLFEKQRPQLTAWIERIQHWEN